MIVSPTRNTIFLILNWPTQYDMTLSKCLPKMKHVKNTGFSAVHVENEDKKNVDSCGAASQPIPLFIVPADSFEVTSIQMLEVPKVISGTQSHLQETLALPSGCLGLFSMAMEHDLFLI